MRLYMILLSTLPIYMCFILGLFLQNAKTGYPSNCHMLLSLFLRYRAAYKRIILCALLLGFRHHREFRTSCASMCMYFLKVLRKHIKERVWCLQSTKYIFFMVYVQIKNKDQEKKVYSVQHHSCFLHSVFIAVLVDIYSK